MTGEEIKQSRKKMHMSRQELAEELKVSKRTVEAYEQGIRILPDDQISVIRELVDKHEKEKAWPLVLTVGEKQIPAEYSPDFGEFFTPVRLCRQSKQNGFKFPGSHTFYITEVEHVIKAFDSFTISKSKPSE